MSNKRVLFSIWAPHEGFIDVMADTDEEATQMVIDLMKDNYRDLNIVAVKDITVETQENPDRTRMN